MTLTDKQYNEYLIAHLGLLYYAGQKTGEIEKYLSFKNFKDLDFNEKFKCREKINEDSELINNYLKDNFGSLTTSEIKIIEGFRNKITGDFIILKCLKNYAIFLQPDTNIFYAVKALSNRFDEMLPDFPVLIKTTILPYENFIIYDGFLQSYGMFFGPEMTWEMNESYKKAKSMKKIIKMINK